MILSQIANGVEDLPGVGPSTAKLFAKLGIFTVADLLTRYPKNYEDRTKNVPLANFSKEKKVHTVCKVLSHNWFGWGNMKTLKILITDGTAQAELVAFNRAFLKDSLPEGSIISVTGHFDIKYDKLQSSSFEAQRIAYDGNLEDYKDFKIPDSGILPVYSLTEGLSQKNFRKTVKIALKQYGKAIDNEIPQKIIQERHLLNKSQAIFFIHRPENFEELKEAKKTLIYEELYQFEYKLAQRTLAHRGILPKANLTFLDEQNKSPQANKAENQTANQQITLEKFKAQLSPKQSELFSRLNFSLTADQINVIYEMNSEIDKSQTEFNLLKTQGEKFGKNPFNMQRLLQGDVGSGKTLVAFFICLRVIDYGGQCAFLAPTELLAKQHAENAARQLEVLGVRVAFLTGNVKAKGRNQLLVALQNGQIDIIIGTHALFSRQVQYKNLELAVIDEQHRFGVSQRESIIAKGRFSKDSFTHTPDILMMSATPIPQTLALTVFGDLDVSTIKTMPQGRKSVITYLTAMGNEKNVYEAVRKELKNGHQAYFVYPRISENAESENSDDLENTAQENFGQSENSSFQNQKNSKNLKSAQNFLNFKSSAKDSKLKSAEEMFDFLSNQVYPEYRCALIHSKVEEDEQNKILNDFYNGKMQILVATTVVEVGVDVANATCIVIENADRFGLAELHQLRGRVGRSSLQSYCFLIYGKNITQIGIDRMKVMHESTDGFYIAEEDLKLRGPGEITGTTQSGYLTLGIADLERDKEILKIARYDAFSQLEELSKINQATT